MNGVGGLSGVVVLWVLEKRGGWKWCGCVVGVEESKRISGMDEVKWCGCACGCWRREVDGSDELVLWVLEKGSG